MPFNGRYARRWQKRRREGAARSNPEPSPVTVKRTIRAAPRIPRPDSPTNLNDESPMTWLMLLIGTAAGVTSGLFGIGGGLVIVPALIYVAKMDPQTAVGTSLGALLLPVGLLGAFAYWRAESLDIRSALLVAAGLFIGTYFGAMLGLSVSPGLFRRLFAVLLVVVAARIWMTS